MEINTILCTKQKNSKHSGYFTELQVYSVDSLLAVLLLLFQKDKKLKIAYLICLWWKIGERLMAVAATTTTTNNNNNINSAFINNSDNDTCFL